MIGKWLTAAGILCLAMAVGCSTEGRLNDDPNAYAKDTKKRVKDFVAQSRREPRTMAADAASLSEALEAHTTAPVGDFKPKYEQLTQKSKELAEEAKKKSPASAEVKKLLKELDDLANELPG